MLPCLIYRNWNAICAIHLCWGMVAGIEMDAGCRVGITDAISFIRVHRWLLLKISAAWTKARTAMYTVYSIYSSVQFSSHHYSYG